jgi:O-antigen ligase
MFALEQKTGVQKDIHSVYLGALVDGGPIGFGLLMYSLWKLYAAVRSIGKKRAAMPAMVVLVLLLFSGLTHTIHFTKWFWVPATICLLLAEQAARERRYAELHDGLSTAGQIIR